MYSNELIEKKNQEINTLKNALESKEKNHENIIQKLQEREQEIIAQNEELRQTQEELLAQREFIETQKKDLERANKRMQANEKILSKAVEKVKASEAEIKFKSIELEERNAEIIAQNEELYQTQEELMTQREFIEKQNTELQNYNSKIKNSIQSAYLIQQAILPYPEKMGILLKNYFVIYRPKDVVSGDFWWLNKIDNKIFLATVDCTGHGVAGAFMTMIGNTLLDKIVRLRGIHNPEVILETLHEEVKVVLRQKETGNNNGMDMSIICMEKTNNKPIKITFSGAKHSLYYITPENKENIQEIKGTRKAIGGEQNENTVFENTVIDLPKNSWVYVGTDGLTDQNNVCRKKFGDKALKQILLDNNHLSAQNQKKLLEKALDLHSHQTEQRDDILFIGFQII